MSAVPDKIIRFILEHHVLTLATCSVSSPQCANLFYAYVEEENAFIAASDETTEHMTNALGNPQIAGSIVLETKTVGKIQGLQFKGLIEPADDDAAAAAYFKAFPYARAMNPTLWRIVPLSMKLTDNRLGFGKKLVWQRGETAQKQ
jgi:uncharacterized protein YhbP (UPF0306 family)